jgi:signal transduction histidine kinase/ActR/RegA family two-component response regulator
MEKVRAKLRVRFSTKVLVPVAAVMVLLLAATASLVDRQLTEQFQVDAGRGLARVDAEFRAAQTLRTRGLLDRLHGLLEEPRYKAVFQSGHRPTLIHAMEDLPEEQGVELAFFTSPDGEILAGTKRDAHIPVGDFEAASSAAVKRALRGQDAVDTIAVGEHLYDAISIPVSGSSGAPIGALTLGSEIRSAEVQEFSLRNGCPMVVLARGRVIVSTVSDRDRKQNFAGLFEEGCAAAPADGATAPIRKTLLGSEHYFCTAGRFDSLSGDDKLGYLLFWSYEEPLQGLSKTQQSLQSASATAIALSVVIIWLLVRKVTAPLRTLSASAEAVGKGDFSQHVEVHSRDECGELAEAFNQMTANLRRSREQLQNTVETLKTTQSQLVQSEKLSGIGEFVAGVAHELNNPLTSVMGFSELLKRADGNPKNQRHLDMIHKSAQRCQKIVQNLLSFARRRQPERKLSNLNELIEAAIEFLQYQLRTSNIEVVARLEARLPKVLVDPHQLQQVFLNIINNARQAIEGHQPKGWVRITTEFSGGNVRVIIQDNGPGISEQNLPKIFDPFFTTKEVGKGTGLGLSLCYGIVKEHGGTITVRSKPGEGATFIVELPCAAEKEPTNRNTAAPAQATSNGREGVGKKVLVIDDEEPILQMVRETLSEQGYQVDVARDGEAALRHLDKVPYDLTLCDWKMPGMNGQQIYERVRAKYPALSDRMIFITGDVINEKAQEFLRERKKVCLSKPFSLVEFRAAIGKALTANGG